MSKRFFGKLSAFVLAAAMVSGTAALAACGPAEGKTEGLTDEPLNATTVIADWSKGEISDDVFASDGWTNSSKEGDSFNTWWKKDNMVVSDDKMELVITPNPDGSEETWNEFFGGEMRTYSYYGYGDYEVRMKPSNVVGTTSTFFVCTGNYDTNPITGEPNPWDEIDIEFLGKDIGEDKSEVQFNFFSNSTGGHEKKITLPFDASAEFHNYGFRWTEDYITWFVDGEPVYRVENSESDPLPSAAGRILTNYWCGTQYANGWMGEYEGGGEVGPEYEWVKTSAEVEWVDANKPGNTPEEPVDPMEPVGEVTDITLDAGTIEPSDASKYTVTVTDGVADVAYTSVGGSDYCNVAMKNIVDTINANNVFNATLANNGTEDAQVRINIATTPEDKVGNNQSSNISATMDNVAVRTDADWGGSFFDIPAGETVKVQIVYDPGRDNVSVEFMIDSSRNDSTVRGGSIAISEVSFFTAAVGDDEPDEPVIVGEKTAIDLSTVTVEGNIVANGGPFTTTVDENKALNVTYTEAKGNSYLNVNLTQGVIGVAQQCNVLTVKVTNNGTETVNLRIDVMTDTKTNNTNACNISATQDGADVRTDTDWGGSFFTVEAGKTITVQIIYGNANTLTGVQFLIDTFMATDTTHAGNITISGLEFAKAE